MWFQACVALLKIANPNVTLLVEKANSELKKADFYAAAVIAYNVQECLNNDLVKYSKASKDIVYLEVSGNIDATNNQLLCAKIIEDYNGLIGDYTEALKNILSILEISGV